MKHLCSNAIYFFCGLALLADFARPDQLQNSQPQISQAQMSDQEISADAALEQFKAFANKINSSAIAALPVQSHGRLKPFDSFARETILFLSGKYSPWGLNAVQVYLGLMLSSSAPSLEILNIRDPNLRTQLGFQKTQRFVAVKQLERSNLESIAKPIMAKQEQNEKSVTPGEKKVLEVVQQLWLLKSVMERDNFLQAVNLNVANGGQDASKAGQNQFNAHPEIEKARVYLQALVNGDAAAAEKGASDLIEAQKLQPMPDLFKIAVPKLQLEVLYNKAKLFFWIGMVYLLMGVMLASGLMKRGLTREKVLGILAIPVVMHAVGFAIRVYITGFAPVTNMYGTMIWMAFGVVLFGTLLFALYRNQSVYGLILVGAGVTLFLTESIPLVLSPDMDPIVAVLRNNFWLTIHVLTISISYAAFTISMLIGNSALIRTILGKRDPKLEKEHAHLAYRVIQLGVFLLTAGIILGGWWADYSWGRFWGWDPKETWALIADLGYLAILHAKYLGWLGSFGILATAPMGYLLVIMAWYGVNFILASGLHSYGFSSGGATIVVSFVIIQLALFGAAMLFRRTRSLELRQSGS